MADSSNSEYVPSSSSSDTEEDDFRATTQELLAGLEESSNVVVTKKKPQEIRQREDMNLEKLKFSIIEDGILKDFPEPNSPCCDEREVVEPCPGAWSHGTPSSPKGSKSAVVLHSVPSTPINVEILDLTTQKYDNLSNDGVQKDFPAPNSPCCDERVEVEACPGAWSPATPTSQGSESAVALRSISCTPINVEILDLTTRKDESLFNDQLTPALSAQLPGDASVGLPIDASQPSYEDSPEIPFDDSLGLPLNVSSASASQTPDTHSPNETVADTVVLKKRSRLSAPKEWKRNQAKNKRLRGEAYTGFRRVNPKCPKKIIQDVPRDGRTMGPTCESPLCAKWQNRLCNTVLEDERRTVFDTFWNDMTSWDMKRMYICGSVDIVNTKRSRVEGDKRSRRNFSYFYFLRIKGEKIPVCQKMFMNTHGITKTEVRYWLEHFHESNLPNARTSDVSPTVDHPENESTENNNDVPGLDNTRVTSQREIADSFFDELPAVPSHYCRKSSKKKYLQGDIKSWAQLYNIYIKKCTKMGTKPFSRFSFDMRRKKKNIDIFVPKKDKCDLCSSFEHGHVSDAVYEKHTDLKEKARAEKEKDKRAAEEGKCHTICFDLMKVQTSPCIRASSAYYKLKLTVHNFTVYNMATHDAKLYWFDETNANMSASTFATCVVDYIEELLNESSKDTVILYSDGCTYQNRNSVLSNALLHLSVSRNVTIIQKYLEKGHTQMECDSVHSLVEGTWENLDIYTPSSYVTLSAAARAKPSPYRATLLHYSFFKDYTRHEIYASIRPGKVTGDPTVVDLRQLTYHPDGHISYKLDFSDNSRDLPNRPKNIRGDFVFPPLHNKRPKIPKDKWNDLQALKPLLPSDTYSYYDSIPCDEVSRRTLKRKEEGTKNKGCSSKKAK